MRPKGFDIHDLIADLEGTCATLQEKLPEGMTEDDLTLDDHQTIDLQIFCCNTCNWWCGAEDQDEDGNGDCTDCVQDYEDNR